MNSHRKNFSTQSPSWEIQTSLTPVLCQWVDCFSQEGRAFQGSQWHAEVSNSLILRWTKTQASASAWATRLAYPSQHFRGAAASAHSRCCHFPLRFGLLGFPLLSCEVRLTGWLAINQDIQLKILYKLEENQKAMKWKECQTLECRNSPDAWKVKNSLWNLNLIKT